MEAKKEKAIALINQYEVELKKLNNLKRKGNLILERIEYLTNKIEYWKDYAEA